MHIKVLALLILILMCCNELPIGEEEFDARGDFGAQDISLELYTSLTEFDKYTHLGGSSNLIVGENADYESRILLKFEFPDTVPQGLDEIKLILKRNNDFDNDTISFSVHVVDTIFDENANWYQRTNDRWWEQPGGDFDSDSLCEVTASGDSCVVTFNYIQLEKIRDADGMILVPRDTGFVYFYSKEGGYAPQFILVKNDVVEAKTLKADCHIVTGPEPFYAESWIGSGMPYRNYIKFVFDSILIGKKAVYGELTFEIEKSFANRDSVEIGVKELLEPLNGFDTQTGTLIALGRFSVDDTLITLDIARHVQRLIDHPDSNFGLFLVLSPENYDLAYCKIVRGSHNLKVGYILPPHGR